MIPEPQRTYVLELYEALGASGASFVIAGAQAMKFFVGGARATKDIDFILDAVKLRGEPEMLRGRLKALGYAVVPESRNFQFQKRIPGSSEVMRIEFMAPAEFKRKSDFRLEVQTDIHARACAGGSIALAESEPRTQFARREVLQHVGPCDETARFDNAETLRLGRPLSQRSRTKGSGP